MQNKYRIKLGFLPLAILLYYPAFLVGDTIAFVLNQEYGLNHYNFIKSILILFFWIPLILMTMVEIKGE